MSLLIMRCFLFLQIVDRRYRPWMFLDGSEAFLPKEQQMTSMGRHWRDLTASRVEDRLGPPRRHRS